jgi:hypothetical protein
VDSQEWPDQIGLPKGFVYNYNMFYHIMVCEN